jgi:prolyl-tRNA synthetase
MILVVDDAIPTSPNLVAGANEAGYHLLNTNYGRDYARAGDAHIVADIAAADAGSGCPNCGSPVRLSRGVEVGNIFKLGTRYSDSLGCTFLDQDGQAKPVIMGSYGIGVGRLMACLAEHYHDENGLTWPISIAPYQAHLVLLPGGEAEAAAARLYADLSAQGVEVFFDDRDERAGVKFKDADIIGLPLRVTVSERSLKNGGAELKRRTSKDSAVVPLDEVGEKLRLEIGELHAALAKKVVKVPFKE